MGCLANRVRVHSPRAETDVYLPDWRANSATKRENTPYRSSEDVRRAQYDDRGQQPHKPRKLASHQGARQVPAEEEPHDDDCSEPSNHDV